MDIWIIVQYVLFFVFNIAVVAKVRTSAEVAGKKFLSSGSFAVIAVWILCFLQMLVVGKFEALQDIDKFVALLQQASTLAMSTCGMNTIRTKVFGGK